MAGNWHQRPGMEEVLRRLRDKHVEVPPGLDDLELADLILDHEPLFRGEQRLLVMLLVVLIEPFEALCRDHLRANCLLLNPVDLAEAAVVCLITEHYYDRRPKPLRACVRSHIGRVARRYCRDPALFLWQPDGQGSEQSRMFHVACGVVNGLPIDARRVVRLAWLDRCAWAEIEALTGHHPEQIERILEQIVLRSQEILGTTGPGIAGNGAGDLDEEIDDLDEGLEDNG